MDRDYIDQLEDQLRWREEHLRERLEELEYHQTTVALKQAELDLLKTDPVERKIERRKRVFCELDQQLESVQNLNFGYMDLITQEKIRVPSYLMEFEGRPSSPVPATDVAEGAPDHTHTPTSDPRGKGKHTYDVDDEVYLLDGDRPGPPLLRKEGRLKRPLKIRPPQGESSRSGTTDY